MLSQLTLTVNDSLRHTNKDNKIKYINIQPKKYGRFRTIVG